ncbi:MAG: MFS transporter [Acidimicrobiia bacterium]
MAASDRAANQVASPIRRALGSPDFRRLFAAQTISRWGDTFNGVALVIVVFRLTGSGVQVAATVAVEIVPVLALGFLAGAVADRSSRRRVMITADVFRAGVALLLALFDDQLWAVYLAAFGLSAGAVFFNPAAISAVPDVVDEADIVGANSALWSAAVVSQIALAPLAGAVVAVAGTSAAFAVNAASFLLSAFFLRRLTLPAAMPTSERRTRRAEAVEGLRLIREHRFLTTLVVVQLLAALSAGATSALLVVLAADHLGVGAGRFGVLLGAIGVGAGLGPLVLQRLVRDVRHPGWLFGPYLLRGLVDLTLAASRSFPVALGALALYGVGTSTGAVTYNAVLQTTVAARLRGRVLALFDVVWQTGRLVSLGIGGLVADVAGIRAVYVACGVLLLGAGAYGLARAGRPHTWTDDGAMGQRSIP